MVVPLRPGDPVRLGGYTLLARIGAGGQGTVFLGEDRAGTRVAVKTLSSDLVEDAVARRRFAGEVALVRRVSSFCVAEVLDADLEGEQPYIVSEYVDGPSLREAVATGGPHSAGALGRLAVSTVTALAAIHDAGIVHRDFKPHNVLLGPDGPRVIDFGIAREHGSALTVTGQIVGTVAYMSPEQISGAEIGPPSDMFSWAATMAFAANGRPMFDADTVPALMHRILSTQPDLPPLPRGLAGVVAACLAKAPAARPTAKDVLLQLIGGSGDAPTVRGPGPAERTTDVNTDARTDVLAPRAAAPAGPAVTRVANGGPGGHRTLIAGQEPTDDPPARRRRRWPWLAGTAVAAIAAVVAVVVIVWPTGGGPRMASVDGTLLFSDSFTDRQGWDGWNFTPGTTVRGYELAKGVFTTQADAGASDVPALSPVPPKASGNERQVMIGATAEIQAGSSGPGSLGLLCSWDEDLPFGYRFQLGLDGTTKIQRVERGTYTTLATGTTDAPSIGRKVGMQAACRTTDSGTRLTFWVDGAQLLDATDTAPVPALAPVSQVGFRVQITEGGTNKLRVSWDDFSVYRVT